MNRERTSYKEEAQRAFSRGEWKRALECFRKHCAQDPKDLRSRLKIAELWERLGIKKEAIQVYQEVAEIYAKDGFLLQAISINKMILRIDPSAKDVNERLAQLYTEKARESKLLRPLPHIPLFSDLNEQELHSLLDRVQVKTFQKDIVVCREGEPGDSLMVICSGKVVIAKRDQKGKEVRICILEEGDFFGEFGFFLDQKRHASVKAFTACEILEISRNELNEIIKTYPRIKEVLQNLFKRRVLDLMLALSPLFSLFNSSEREEVLKRFRLLKIPGETLVFKGGDAPTSLYMIKSGEVEIFIQDRRGKRVSVSRLRSGNFFGEIGVLLNTPRMAFAKTTQASELLELTKEDFQEILRQFPKLQSSIKEISSQRLAQTKEILSQEAVEKAREPLV